MLKNIAGSEEELEALRNSDGVSFAVQVVEKMGENRDIVDEGEQALSRLLEIG